MGRPKKQAKPTWARLFEEICDGKGEVTRAGLRWEDWENIALRADGAAWPDEVLAAYFKRTLEETRAHVRPSTRDHSTAAGLQARIKGSRRSTVYVPISGDSARVRRVRDGRTFEVRVTPGLVNSDPCGGWLEKSHGRISSIREWLGWPEAGPTLHDIERAFGRTARRLVQEPLARDRGLMREEWIIPPGEVWRVLQEVRLGAKKRRRAHSEAEETEPARRVARRNTTRLP